jgi:hypothetical protein
MFHDCGSDTEQELKMPPDLKNKAVNKVTDILIVYNCTYLHINEIGQVHYNRVEVFSKCVACDFTNPTGHDIHSLQT